MPIKYALTAQWVCRWATSSSGGAASTTAAAASHGQAAIINTPLTSCNYGPNHLSKQFLYRPPLMGQSTVQKGQAGSPAGELVGNESVS